jgi:hypothetical protein
MKNRRQREVREAELAALADGSLPAGRRGDVEALIDASPELQERLAEQRRAVAVVTEAAAGVEAPAGLRARVEARRGARRGQRGWRIGVAGAVAAAAAAAFAVALALPGGSGGPSVAEAATLGVLPAEQAAPTARPGRPTLLSRSVEGVAFPSWQADFGWRASGARSDRLDGRQTATVFYEKGGKRIGYTIVGGNPLDVPDDATPALRTGTELHRFERDGRVVVTWLRRGRTCILSGTGVERGVLLKLASWNGKGSVPF